MKLPIQISFRNLGPSPAIEAAIRRRAGRLERFFDRITACRVVVEAPHKRRRKGRLYGIRIDLTVPGREIAVTHKGPQDHAHEDIYVAIRDAFDTVAQLLEEHARRGRGEVKTHQRQQSPRSVDKHHLVG
jgi:ribosomal subunit interface protein